MKQVQVKIVFKIVFSKIKCTAKDIDKEVKPWYDAQTYFVAV